MIYGNWIKKKNKEEMRQTECEGEWDENKNIQKR